MSSIEMQYKLMVEMADRVSERRAQSNKFYISIISSIFVFSSLISLLEIETDYLLMSFFLIASLNIILCFIWIITIDSYKKLNKAKYKVIQQMEDSLEFKCYQIEEGYLNDIKYIQFTKIEKYIPYVFILLNLILIISITLAFS